ncbi:MAG: prepilin peptidase [Bacillota bacterium]
MATIAAVLLAAWYDIKTRKIPDWITLTLILAGIIFSLVDRGFWLTAATLFLGSILCELFYRLKTFGGGDLKLLLGLALIGGPLYGLAVFYASLLAALPLFLVYMIKDKMTKPNVPYALAILSGVLWVYGKGVL